MNKSESIKNIGAALTVFHEKMGKIKKDAQNPFFKSTYASLSTILEHIAEPLKAAGLIYTQFPGEGLTTILIHAASGEWIESEYKIHPVKNDPQAVGSAITYARRYALCSVLGLNVEDDDGNLASGKINGNHSEAADKSGLPWMNKGDDNYEKAVMAIRAGKRTIADVKKKFQLSSATEANLGRDIKLVASN